MVRALVLGGLAAAALALFVACDSDGDRADPDVLLSVATVRQCLRDAGSTPEAVPSVIQGVPKLNALVRRAKHGRGVVRTPPPDPTFTGFVVAYFLLFDDAASSRRAAAMGREGVLEYRNRFRHSVGSETDYEMAVVQRNVLALYLEDPSDAERQKEKIENCIREAPG